MDKRTLNASVRAAQKQKMLNDKMASERRQILDYEYTIKSITEVHLLGSKSIDWNEYLNLPFPKQPDFNRYNYFRALDEIETYKANFFEKIFKLENKKRRKLQNKLLLAEVEDKNIYEKLLLEYQTQQFDWMEKKDLAQGVLNYNPLYYSKVVSTINPFVDLVRYYTSLTLSYYSKSVTVDVRIDDKEFMPVFEAGRTASNRFFNKILSASKRNEIYREFLCSLTMKIAKDLFLILPIGNVKVNIFEKRMNYITGYEEIVLIFINQINRDIFFSLNFKNIKPSFAINNFNCLMKYNKSIGFQPLVEDGKIKLL